MKIFILPSQTEDLILTETPANSIPFDNFLISFYDGF